MEVSVLAVPKTKDGAFAKEGEWKENEDMSLEEVYSVQGLSQEEDASDKKLSQQNKIMYFYRKGVL